MSTKAASKKGPKSAAGGDRVSATPERSSTPRPASRATPVKQHQETSPSASKRPVSPARLQRLSERVSLQNLNDRFATVVEINKRLTNENASLKIQIQKKEERTVSQSQNVKDAYEKEIQQLRLMVDTVSKEKAQTQLHLSSAQEDLNAANASLKKKNSEVDSLTKKNTNLDNEVKNLRDKVADALDDKKRFDAELKELKGELHRSEEQKKALRKQVEEETIARVDLENRNQSLNEELEFKTQMYQRELKEAHKKETIYTKEIHETARTQYVANLEEERRKNAALMETYRTEMQERYESQISILEDENNKLRHELANAKKNIKELNSTNTLLISEVDQTKRDHNLVKNKLHDIQKLLEQERDWNKITLEKKDADFEEVRLKYAELIEEHHDLMDEKMRIDAELNTYRQLLEQEEHRLNIDSPPFDLDHSLKGYTVRETPPSRISRRTAGTKRKAFVLEETEENVTDIEVIANANGDIEIVDHDQDGKFVKIRNKGSEDVSIGNWTLVRVADSLSAKYKFPRSAVAKPNQVITIWSSDAQATHQPPTDFVMKSQNWFTADQISTKLVDSEQAEMASRVTIKRVSQNTSRGYNLGQNDQGTCTLM